MAAVPISHRLPSAVLPLLALLVLGGDLVATVIGGHGAVAGIAIVLNALLVVLLVVQAARLARRGAETATLRAENADLARALQAQAAAHAEEAMHRRSAEQRISAITDHLPARISLFDADERVMFANRYCGEVHGCDPAALVGRTILEVRGEHAYREIKPHVDRALRGERVHFEHAIELDGQTRHFRQEYVPDVAADGTVRGFHAISFDVTDFRRAEDALHLSQARLRDITDNLPALIAYIDTDLRLQFANRTFEEWVGITPQAAIGRRLTELLPTPAADARTPRLLQALAGHTVAFEAPFVANGVERHTHITYLPDRRPDGRVAGVYALVNDITSMKRVERELDRLARIDALTGLPNRREFDQRLVAAIDRCEREHLPLGLMFLDIDRFKAINDSYGHAAGDTVLRHVAACLREAVPEANLVARLAGDEFVVIMESLARRDQAGEIADAVLAALRRPAGGTARPVAVSASIGIALHDGAAATPSELLSRADAALYDAKAAGRNTWRLAEAEPSPAS